MRLTVLVEPAPASLAPRIWYEVRDAEKEFHLWIVEYDPRDDAMTCTCDRRWWCDHRQAVKDMRE